MLSHISGDFASKFLQLTLGGLVNSVSFVLEVDDVSSLLVVLLEFLSFLQHTVDIVFGKSS